MSFLVCLHGRVVVFFVCKCRNQLLFWSLCKYVKVKCWPARMLGAHYASIQVDCLLFTSSNCCGGFVFQNTVEHVITFFQPPKDVHLSE